MSLRVTEVDHDAAVLKKKIISLAGEWLERAGMARGRFEEGSDKNHVEGVPEQYQVNNRYADNVKIVAADTLDNLRTDVRPQAVKE